MMGGLLMGGAVRRGEAGSWPSAAWLLGCLSLEAIAEERGISKELLNSGAAKGGGTIMGVVKDSGNMMEGNDTTGFVLAFPNMGGVFPLEEDEAAGMEGTAAGGLFISMGTGGGAIGSRSF